MKLPSIPRVVTLVALSLITLVVVGERVVSLWLQNKLRQIAEKNNLSVESIEVSLYRRTVRVYNFEVHPTDSANHIHIEKGTVRGISIYELLRNHSLHASRVIIENASIPFTRMKKQKRDTASTHSPQLKGIYAQSLLFTNTSVTYADSSSTWSGLLDLDLGDFSLKDPSDPSSRDATVRSFTLKTLKMKPKKGFFAATVARIEFEKEKGLLSFDSVHIIPVYSKLKFAHAIGTQSTWTDVHVPRIEVKNFDIKYHQDTTLVASYVLVKDSHVEAFRDKRVPITKKSETPLPMKMLRDLGIAIEIDSIEFTGADVTYEHFAEGAFEPGRLHLSGIRGLFRDVYNRSYSNKRQVTTLTSSANVEGGRMQAQFTLPLEPGVQYQAKGKLTKVSLSSLNPMLENAAFVSIESGRLNELDFQFHFDNNLSVGEVVVDYDDLKIRTLKKEPSGNENQVKTFVANTALRNKNHRTGAINNPRDKRRFIFHYMASSIHDGVRDAVVPAAPDVKKKK